MLLNIYELFCSLARAKGSETSSIVAACVSFLFFLTFAEEAPFLIFCSDFLPVNRLELIYSISSFSRFCLDSFLFFKSFFLLDGFGTKLSSLNYGDCFSISSLALISSFISSLGFSVQHKPAPIFIN